MSKASRPRRGSSPLAAVICFLAALLVAAPSAAPAAAQTAAPMAGSAAGSAGSAGVDPIVRGDMIRLAVLRDTTLSGEFPVNEYGTVVLPLLGEMEVAGRAARDVRREVIDALGEVRYGGDVELIVLRRVRVVGEVNQPGVYYLDPTMTVADAIASARGRTPLAHEGRVILERDGAVTELNLTRSGTASAPPIRSGDEIRIPRRSWADRNVGVVVGALTAAAGLAVTLFVR